MNKAALLLLLLLSFASAHAASRALPDEGKAPSDSSRNYLNVDGIQLWFEECGTTNLAGPAIVLLHDGLLHSVTWDAVWAPLCEKYHVVRYDRRGYGRSKPSTARFAPEDDLLKIMQRVKMNRALLLGNSSGGALALDFAISHPEMVAGLFLIGPVVHGMPSTEYFNDRGSRNNAPLAKGDTKAAAQNWSQDHFLIMGPDPQRRKLLYDALAQNPQNLTVNGALEIRPSPPTALRLSQIQVPVLVLAGEADIPDVFAYSGAIEAAAPLASFEVIQNSGHLIQIQQPEKLVSRLNRFYALVTRKAEALSHAQLSAYTGTYMCFGQASKVTIRDQNLMLELPGEPYYWLFPASDSRFFMRTEETELEFKKNAEGKFTEMLIHNSDGSLFTCPKQ